MKRDERFYVNSRHLSQMRATAGEIREAQERQRIGQEIADLTFAMFKEMCEAFPDEDPRLIADALHSHAPREAREWLEILRQEVRFGMARAGHAPLAAST